MGSGIKRHHWLIALALAAATALILLWMGRPLICTCGVVKLWTGAVQSADNSQHIADWYTPSHIIHGFLFYLFGWLFLRRNHARVTMSPGHGSAVRGTADPNMGGRYLAAVAIEAGWELLENSKYIIDRYREATFAFGYNGDSVLNSMADLAWMSIGFFAARRVPVWPTIAIAIAFELLTLWTIRDNLTLNVLMLVAPVEAIKVWQGG